MFWQKKTLTDLHMYSFCLVVFLKHRVRVYRLSVLLDEALCRLKNEEKCEKSL